MALSRTALHSTRLIVSRAAGLQQRYSSLSISDQTSPPAPPPTRPSSSTPNRKKEGDISSVFVSLSAPNDGEPPATPPARFAAIKRDLLAGRDCARLTASWERLLEALGREIQTVERERESIVPSIGFEELRRGGDGGEVGEFREKLRRRGVAVVRGVVERDIARGYKEEVERYVKRNPSTKAFPPHDPQVYELYWSPSQMQARVHPNMLITQQLLMETWHSKDPDSLISTSHPASYADRVRIRQPGDAGFALGPHVDGGSVERWEKMGYGRTDVYEKIWTGDWEQYDPWEASARLDVVSDLYDGAGACTMFRMFQGWLSMSKTGPYQGTLLVNPMIKLATAYCLLRPFFAPVIAKMKDPLGENAAKYLSPENWRLDSEPTAMIHGASEGHCQELNDESHPHLELSKSMVHIPDIEPGDYVVWHCDTIHAVDKVHNGKSDSSVLYIPTCPLTEANARYMARQRDAFLDGVPAPDFPGGAGESRHIGRPTADFLKSSASKPALRSLGLEAWPAGNSNSPKGQRNVLASANRILGF